MTDESVEYLPMLPSTADPINPTYVLGEVRNSKSSGQIDHNTNVNWGLAEGMLKTNPRLDSLYSFKTHGIINTKCIF